MPSDPGYRELLQLTLRHMEDTLHNMKQMRMFAISGTVISLLDSQIESTTAELAEIKRKLEKQ